MLSNIQRNIILRAVKIRMAKGEELESILKSYTKLTDADREEIKAALGQRQGGIIWAESGFLAAGG